jgi:hypothetical protein
MSLEASPTFPLASKVSRRRAGATRHEELSVALRRALRLGRRPTIIEQAEIDRAARLSVLAEQAAADPATSTDVQLRCEHFADAAVRRLLRGRLKALEAMHGWRS